MCKSIYMFLVCVFVFSYGAYAVNRGTFQAKLRHCRWLCAYRDSQQKNTIQTCWVLGDHQNVTVTKCVSRCLVKHEENISNSTECQCQNGKCNGKSVNESSSLFASNVEISTTVSSSTSEIPASTFESTESVSTSDSLTPSENSSTLRFIEDFENDEESVSEPVASISK